MIWFLVALLVYFLIGVGLFFPRLEDFKPFGEMLLVMLGVWLSWPYWAYLRWLKK